MGRLLRKKTSTKKKKKQSETTLAVSNASGTVEQKSLPGVPPSEAEASKRPAEPQRKFTVVQKAVSDISFIGKSVQFLREVKVELKKVTWPSRKQTLGSTLVVIILVIVISLFLGVVDVGLSAIFHMVLQ